MAPHGKPDWGHLPSTTVFGLDDMAEAVVRLDSPVMWDRRGQVVMIDDFDQGLGKALPNIPAPDGVLYRYCGRAAHGTICLRIVTGVDGANNAAVAWELPPPVFSPIGLECSFGFSDDTRYVRLDIEHVSANIYWRFRLRYDYVTSVFEVYNPAGGYTQCLAGIVIPFSGGPTHLLKLVVHPTLGFYWRMILDNTEYDLSAFPGRVATPSPGEELTYRIYVEGQMVNSTRKKGTLYLDRVIGTQNEPII